MFYVINHVTGVQEPYRVEAIDRDRRDQGRPKRQFNEDEDEAHHHEKYLKASETLYKKKSVMVASEIMNRQLLELEETLLIEEAWERIKEHEIKYFPIINKEGKLLGMLTEREIYRELQHGKGKTLKEITAKHTLCVEPDTELQEVMKVFSNQKIEAVPVVDKELKVIGMLTQKGLLHTMLKIAGLQWNT